MPPRFNPTRASPFIIRARFALYGTIGLCTYTSLQTYSMKATLYTAVKEKNQQLWEAGREKGIKLRDHYCCTQKNIEEGRYYTLITSAWNHTGGLHFFGNMLGLWSFGRVIAYGFGAGTFMTIFYGGALAGNLLCLGLDKRFGSQKENNPNEKDQNQRMTVFLGASGGVSAILAANACLNPWGSMIIGIMFIPVPVPNIVGALGFAGFSVWAQYSDVQTNVAHLGHLGGLAYGFMWFAARFRFLPF